MCENAYGVVIVNNGVSGNDCVRNWFDVEYQVISINMACLSGGGGSSDSGGGTNSNGSSNTSETGNTSNNSGSGYGG